MSTRFATLCLLALAACGDDTTDAPADTSAPADTTVPDDTVGTPDTDLDTAAPDTPPTRVSERVRLVSDFRPEHAANAAVTIILPGGDAREFTTDAEGAFVVEDIDYAQGPMSVLALDGDMPVALVGFRQDDFLRDDDGTILVPHPVDLAPTGALVDVSGTAENMADPEDFLFVGSNLALLNHLAKGPDYRLTGVQADKAGDLVAAEIRQPSVAIGRSYEREIVAWAERELPASSEDASVPIDLGLSLAPTEVTGSFSVTAGGDPRFLERFRAGVFVYTLQGSATGLFNLSGLATRIAIDGAQVDFDLSTVQLARALHTYTRYEVTEGDTMAFRLEPGPPRSGALEVPLLPIPVVGDPGPAPYDATVLWDTPPAEPFIHVRYSAGPQRYPPALTVALPPGSLAFDLDDYPPLRELVLTLEDPHAWVEFCRFTPAPWSDIGWCGELSAAEPVRLTRP